MVKWNVWRARHCCSVRVAHYYFIYLSSTMYVGLANRPLPLPSPRWVYHCVECALPHFTGSIRPFATRCQRYKFTPSTSTYRRRIRSNEWMNEWMTILCFYSIDDGLFRGYHSIVITYMFIILAMQICTQSRALLPIFDSVSSPSFLSFYRFSLF